MQRALWGFSDATVGASPIGGRSYCGGPTARSRVLLIHMAESWMRLAQQAEKNSTTDLVYETPPPHEHAVLHEQHQQVQRKTNRFGA